MKWERNQVIESGQFPAAPAALSSDEVGPYWLKR
jgi:hypothetical protein